MNAPALRIRLFGSLELVWGDEPLAAPSSAARALLGYLVLHHDRPIPRDRLAGLFWPERSDAQARRALSQALWQIRSALGSAADRLVAEQDAVAFAFQPGDWLDVAEFEEKVDKYTGRQGDKPLSTGLPELSEAIVLYRGDLLEECYDDWALLERERLREMYLRALGRLITLHKQQGDYQQALAAAQRLAAADPLREEAHRELMRLYHLLGRPRAALEQFVTLRNLLQEELGVAPAQATFALYHEIAAALEEPAPPHLPVPPPPPPLLHDLGRLPFVGRVNERAVLLDALQAASRGHGGLALVEGDAGVGKTRLVEEIVADARWRGFQVGAGKADQLAAVAPYQLLRDALAPLLTPLRVAQLAELVEPAWLSALAPLFPVVAEHLPDLPPLVSLEPREEQQRLWEGLAHCLAGLAKVAPLLLVLEDLHWADEATLAVLPHLVPHLPANRLLFLLTCRAAETRERAAVRETLESLDRAVPLLRLRLLPFERAEAVTLVQRAIGTGQTDDRAVAFANRLQDETQGNALFLIEVLKALLEQGVLAWSPNGAWALPPQDVPLPMPASVEELVGARVVRLSVELCAVLQWVAALGEEADFAVLRAASATDVSPVALADRLSKLCQLGFLAETRSGYRFEHDVVRDVVYRAVAANQRQRLHRQAGQALEAVQPDRVPGLAHHFFLGQVWDKAASYNQRAASQAAAIYAHHEAVLYYSHALEALECLPGPVDRVRCFELRLAREAAYALLGERPAQVNDLRTLQDLLGDPALDTPARRARIALCWTGYYEAISDYPAALAAARTAVEQAQAAGDARAEYRAYLYWGRLLRHQGEMSSAREHLEQALAVVQATGDLSAQAVGLNDLGVVFYESGCYDAALDYYERALAACRPTGDRASLATVHNSLGNLFHHMADYPAAQDHHQQALALRRAIGDRRGEASGLYNLSLVYHDSGDQESARRTLEQVCELTHAIGDRRIEGYAFVFLGLVLEYMGELDAARSAYATGLALRREVGLPALAVDALAGLARVATAQGNHARAVAYAAQVLAWLDEHGPEGVGDPVLAYKGAYRALLAAGQQERGQAALRAGYALLLAHAGNITDPERRRAFLHDYEPNRTVWNDYQALHVHRAQVRLPAASAPAGRPLRDDDYVQVTWTVAAPEDDAIADHAERRRHRLLRLLREAAAQSAAPTVEALAGALQVSARTVKRDLAALRAEGHDARTRGARAC